jgi:hypothetical protein
MWVFMILCRQGPFGLSWGLTKRTKYERPLTAVWYCGGGGKSFWSDKNQRPH